MNNSWILRSKIDKTPALSNLIGADVKFSQAFQLEERFRDCWKVVFCQINVLNDSLSTRFEDVKKERRSKSSVMDTYSKILQVIERRRNVVERSVGVAHV